MKKTSRTLLAAVAGWLAASAAVDAQTASSASPASPKDETVLELSPFVTTAAADRGYAATSSLAGTRIRTDLRDIANSISVVTSDFMKDVNATDSASLLVYTASTETAGSGGNYSGGSLNGIERPKHQRRPRLSRSIGERDHLQRERDEPGRIHRPDTETAQPCGTGGDGQLPGIEFHEHHGAGGQGFPCLHRQPERKIARYFGRGGWPVAPDRLRHIGKGGGSLLRRGRRGPVGDGLRDIPTAIVRGRPRGCGRETRRDD